MNTSEYSLLPSLYRRFVLQPLGLSTENSIVLWLLLIFGSITVGGLWYFQGNVAVVLGVIYLTGIFLLSFLRIDYSFYVLMAAVLLFDQFGIPGFDPFTYQVDFFKNLKEITYVPFFEAGMMNPIELHLGFMILSLLMLLAIKKDFTWRPIPVFIPFIILVVLFIASFLKGMSGGGDFMVALWEVRAFFYFFIVYLIVPQIIRSREQIHVLVWIFIIGISFKAFQAIGRFIELGFTTGGLETLTNHEDPVFTVTLLMFLLGFLIYNIKNKQRLWLLVLLLPLMLGFYMGMRRAAYASFMVTFMMFLLLLPPATLWKFVKYSVPCVIVLAIYSALFWNNQGRLGRPIQMVKSGFEKPSVEVSYQDYYSNLYREMENYNLAQTVVNNTVTGTGFGQKYDQPMPLVYLTFPLREYIPHNEIFWVVVKMGAVGFFAFWFFFNAFVARGVKVLRHIDDPYLKVVLMVAIVAVINQMVISYFDLQLTYYRNMIYLGCLMGFLPAIEQYAKYPENDDTQIKRT